jgi:hypothetical protein
MRKVIAIHADCDDLKFLTPLQRTLTSWVGENLSWFCLNNLLSHDPAVRALERTDDCLVLILLHGRSDGFRAGDYSSSPDEDDPAMFLKKGSMGLLAGKRVFCLSCKGNEHADEIVQKGARVFLGFDDVPFSRFDPVTGEQIYQHSLTVHCQKLILNAVTAALERLILKNESFDDVANFIKLYVRQTALEFVHENASEEYRSDVPHLFMKMADTVKVNGVGQSTFDGP